MVRGYVFVETQRGRSDELVARLRGNPLVRDMDLVVGPYDVVVIVDAETLEAMGRLVTRDVHAGSDVIRSLTCTTLEPVATEDLVEIGTGVPRAA